jgi:integrase
MLYNLNGATVEQRIFDNKEEENMEAVYRQTHDTTDEKAISTGKPSKKSCRHLTQKYINGLKANGNRQWINDDEVGGLRLYIGPQKGRTWYYSFRDDTGKRTTHRLGFADVMTLQQARDEARDFRNKLVHGENPHDTTPTPENITVGALLSGFYDPWLLAERKGGKATSDMIRSTFKAFLDKPVAGLTVLALEQWRNGRLKYKAKRATINRLAGALKSMFNWAVQRSLIEKNPIEKFRPLRENDSDGIIRYLSGKERERLMNALDEREALMRTGRDSHNLWLKARRKPPRVALSGEFADFLKPLTLVALNTGARRGALFGLKWGDVDIENKTVLFRAANAKSEKPLRVPLNSTAAATLAKWKLQSARRSGDDLVFPSPRTGKRFDNINKGWASLMRRAGIKNFRFHDTRHDYASQLVMSGVDLFTVKELLGHADIKMTQRYAHLAPDKLAAAVEVIVREQENTRARG